jgi:chromosome partitioning protein
MGKVISVSIFKGGAGKTASAVSLASALTVLGAKVLLIDLDQQASATRHLGLDPEQENPNLYHVFKKQVTARTAVKQLSHGLSIIPGNSLLAAIEEALEEGDETMLRDLIVSVRDEFDYIILDSPPGKAMLSFNALSAADEILIPLPAERPALDGVQDLLRFVHEVVWEKYNPGLKIKGILPTMYKRTTTHSAGVVDKAREIWGDKVFPIEVPEAITFPRAYSAGLPLPLFDPAHEGTQAYLAVVARLLYTPPAPPSTPELAVERDAATEPAAGDNPFDEEPMPMEVSVEGNEPNEFTV